MVIPVLNLIRACGYRLACRPGTVVVLGFFVIVSASALFALFMSRKELK